MSLPILRDGGTVFHDSHLPLWKWFLAIYLIGESKKGISGKQLQRTLGVLTRRPGTSDIGSARQWRETRRCRCEGSWRSMRRGSAADIAKANRTARVAIASRWCSARSNATANFALRSARDRGASPKAPYRGFVKDKVHDRAEMIFTDSDSSWGEMTDWNTKHRKVDHSKEEWVRGIVHTNTIENVWSLLKRSVVGTYHQLSAKHLPAYWTRWPSASTTGRTPTSSGTRCFG